MRSHAEGDPRRAQEGAPRAFPDTRWSQVALVGGTDPARAHRALEHLCQAYWQPIYTFLRRKGFSPHDAEDSTQPFFLRILQRSGAIIDAALDGATQSFSQAPSVKQSKAVSALPSVALPPHSRRDLPRQPVRHRLGEGRCAGTLQPRSATGVVKKFRISV